ncbi:TetR/AcrR family transcriptional regulator [Streptomyces sp. NPDC002845]
MPLTPEAIYTTAFKLIEADGVEALTMRKLATALDANPMSLYHHVPNKEALLRGVAKLVASQFHPPEQTDLPWQERLRQLALSYRAFAHHDALVMAHTFASPDFVQADFPFWLGLTSTLRAAGVPEREISRTGAVLSALFTGLLVSEVSGALQQWTTLRTAPAAAEGEENPPMASDREVEAMFRRTLDAVIAVLESQLAATPADREAD